ncbi:hypothetical protein CBR_g37560 [Chara braunii]|uniref:Ubiquitin-like protease family profile domain-containing protein n=1 Tax=Chara braunii TaxID=69332 RepID=A0A388LNB2_CHABU|nr:hypothetical protein CBR_g37560 [Chara braunii]|eukprot:GBG83759.1 hypothetical protein CBR_g37560 [Chara braunii]
MYFKMHAVYNSKRDIVAASKGAVLSWDLFQGFGAGALRTPFYIDLAAEFFDLVERNDIHLDEPCQISCNLELLQPVQMCTGFESSGAPSEGGDLGFGASFQLHRGEEHGRFNDSEEEEEERTGNSLDRGGDRRVLSIPRVETRTPAEKTYELPTLKLAPLGLEKPKDWKDELAGQYYYYAVAGQHNAAAARTLLGTDVAVRYNFERWPARMVYFSDADFEGYFLVSADDNKKDLKAPPRQQKLSMKDIRWCWKERGYPRAVMGNPSGKQAQTGSSVLAKQGKLGMREGVQLVKCDRILVRLWNYYQFKYENRPDSDWMRSCPFLRKREAILGQFKSQGLDAALWDGSRKLVGDSSLFKDCPSFMGCEDDKLIKATKKLVQNKKLSIDWKNKVLSVLTSGRSKSMDVVLAEGMVHIRWQDLGDVTSIAPFGVDPLEAQMKVVELEKAIGITKCHTAVLDLCDPVDIKKWTQQAFESLNALLEHLFPSHWTVVAFVPREHAPSVRCQGNGRKVGAEAAAEEKLRGAKGRELQCVLIDTDEEASTGVLFDTNVSEEDSDTKEIALNYHPAPVLPSPGSSTAGASSSQTAQATPIRRSTPGKTPNKLLAKLTPRAVAPPRLRPGSAVPLEHPSRKDDSIHFEGHNHTRSNEADWGHDMIWHPGTIQPAIRKGEWIMVVVDSAGEWEPCSRLPKSEYLQLASSGVAEKVASENPHPQATDPAVVNHTDRLFLELQDKGWLQWNSRMKRGAGALGRCEVRRHPHYIDHTLVGPPLDDCFRRVRWHQERLKCGGSNHRRQVRVRRYPNHASEAHDGEPVLRSATGAEVSEAGAKTKSAGIRTSVSSCATSGGFPTRQGTASAVEDGPPAEFNARLDSGPPYVLRKSNSAGFRTCWGTGLQSQVVGRAEDDTCAGTEDLSAGVDDEAVEGAELRERDGGEEWVQVEDDQEEEEWEEGGGGAEGGKGIQFCCVKEKTVESADSVFQKTNDRMVEKMLAAESRLTLRARARGVCGGTFDNGIAPRVLRVMGDISRGLVPPHHVLSTFGDDQVRITAKDPLIVLLVDGNLNDEVVNFYMALSGSTACVTLETSSGLRVFSFNSFFFSKLQLHGHDGVERWAKNVDLLHFDMIFVPVHKDNDHWILLSINLRDNVFEIFDSYPRIIADSRFYLSVFELIVQYLERDTSHSRSPRSWKSMAGNVVVEGVPRQVDGASCGVFMLTFGTLLQRGDRPPFRHFHSEGDEDCPSKNKKSYAKVVKETKGGKGKEGDKVVQGGGDGKGGKGREGGKEASDGVIRKEVRWVKAQKDKEGTSGDNLKRSDEKKGGKVEEGEKHQLVKLPLEKENSMNKTVEDEGVEKRKSPCAAVDRMEEGRITPGWEKRKREDRNDVDDRD